MMGTLLTSPKTFILTGMNTSLKMPKFLEKRTCIFSLFWSSFILFAFLDFFFSGRVLLGYNKRRRKELCLWDAVHRKQLWDTVGYSICGILYIGNNCEQLTNSKVPAEIWASTGTKDVLVVLGDHGFSLNFFYFQKLSGFEKEAPDCGKKKHKICQTYLLSRVC